MRRFDPTLLCAVVAIGCASCSAGGDGNAGAGGTSVAGAGAGGTSGTAGSAAGTSGTAGSATGDDGGRGGASGGGGESGGDGASAGTGGVEAGPIVGTRCNGRVCDPGFTCEYVAVQCVRAPCPPQPQCVKRPTCSASSDPSCPGAGACVDDPSTGCEFDSTVTCPGVCTCLTGGPTCVTGERWNPSVSVCACEPIEPDEV